MIHFLRFDSIDDYSFVPESTNNIWWEIHNDPTHYGPRFAGPDWVHDLNFLHDSYGKLVFGSNHRFINIDLNKDIEEQITHNSQITNVLHFILPVKIENFYTEKNILKKVAEKFKHIKHVKFCFSNSWDLYDTNTDKIQLATHLVEQLSDIEPERIFVFACNKFFTDELKQLAPNWNTHYFNYCFRALKVKTPSYVSHNDLREKHFLCLNNVSKPHRQEIFDHLDNDKSYKSMLSKKIKLDLDKNINLDSISTMAIGSELPVYYTKNSYIMICNETYFYADNKPTGWLTEKSIKPMLSEQMFILVSRKGIHSLVQDLGFKLFDQVIDYSFDTQDDGERLESIKKEIDRLSKINIQELHKIFVSDYVQDIIKHNRAVFEEYTKLNPSNILTGKQTEMRL
jgi:hypothetical protein